MVECDLAKVEVAGSNPVSRSRLSGRSPCLAAPCDSIAFTALSPRKHAPKPLVLQAGFTFTVAIDSGGRREDTWSRHFGGGNYEANFQTALEAFRITAPTA